MPKKSDFFEPSETGNWNVAADFTKLKIMKLLYEADQYEIIATFGTSDLVEEFMINDHMKSLARMKALRRLLKALQMTINNTKFAVKKQDKDKMKKFLDTLKKIEKVLPALQKKVSNQKIGQVTASIHEENFEKVLNHLIQIKSDINEPLNRADLIFTHMEDFDPKAAKDAIKKGLTEVG